MAASEPQGHAVRMSTQGPRPGAVPDGAAGAAGLPSARSGGAALRLGERPPAAMEKRGPYMVTRAPSIQAKLRECGGVYEGLCRSGLLWPRVGPQSPMILSPEGKGFKVQRSPAAESPGSSRIGKTRLTQDLLTSREAPGPGQGRSTEKGHAGGLTEPPRFFRKKVSVGFTSSLPEASKEGL